MTALRGRLFALASAACFATLGVFSVKAYDRGAGELEVLTWRILGALVILGGLGLALRVAVPRGRMLALVLGLGIFQLGTSVGLIVGFDRAPAALVVLMFYAYPVLVSVGATLLYREPFGRQQALVLALGLGGVVLTVGRPGSVPWIGVGLGLLAAVCTTGYFLGGRYAMSRDVDPLSITTLLYLAPSVVLVGIASVRGFDWPSAGAAGFASGVTVAGTVVPILMLFAAIKTIGAAATALLSTIEPFLAVVFAYAFLDERLSGLQLAGGALIVAAVVVSAMPGRAAAQPAGA